MNDVKILQAEVAALRAELARRNAPPMPSLSYYSDPSDVIAIVRARGVHPTEADWLATFMEAWIPRN